MTDVMPQSLTMPPFEYTPRPYHGPSRDEVLALRRQHVNPAVFTLYRDPLMIVEGKMQYVFDETGRRYLDLFAGIATVSCGHCHPEVVRRVQEQTATLQHSSTIYLHPNLSLMARKLAAKMPPGLEVTYFVNSGSEANDLAVTMARLFTGNQDVIALEERVSRWLTQLGRTDVTSHLEVSRSGAAGSASRALPRSGAESVHRHGGGDRVEKRRRYPRADSLFDAREDRRLHRRADPGRGWGDPRSAELFP